MNEARARWERLNVIRREKFDLVLPIAMRENHVDMWIHVMREGNPDPLVLDLGDDLGYFVFTDRGGDRIERAVFGGRDDVLDRTGAYDFFRSEEELGEYVAAMDPKKIAVNTSEWLAVADGISYSGYVKLQAALGEEYSSRIVSAGPLITDFRVRRVVSEIVEYGKLGELTRQLIERVLSNEVIVPGHTTLEDMAWWMEEQLIGLGMANSCGFNTPAVLYSATAKDGEQQSSQYIIQRGDLLKLDTGISFMNLGTDVKRYAYVLQPGEKTLPAGIQFAWDQALRVRDVLRPRIVVGRTADETLKDLGRAVEEAGYVYINTIVDPSRGGVPSLEPDGDPKEVGKTWVWIDCHCVGNTGNSEVASGPSMAGFRADRGHLTIKPNNIFAFEFTAATPTPEMGGWRLPIGIEDDAIVTENGVQWLYSPNARIHLVR